MTEKEYKNLDIKLKALIDEKFVSRIIDSKYENYGIGITVIIAVIGLIINIARTVYVIWFRDRNRFYNRIRNPKIFTKLVIKHCIAHKIERKDLRDIVYNEVVNGFKTLTNAELDLILEHSLKN